MWLTRALVSVLGVCLCATGTISVFCDGGLGSQQKEHIIHSPCPDQHSVTVTGLAAGVSLHLAAMLHSTVVGHLHWFADVGFPALQHLLLVQLLVYAERHQLRARQPLPGHTQVHTFHLHWGKKNKSRVRLSQHTHISQLSRWTTGKSTQKMKAKRLMGCSKPPQLFQVRPLPN